MQEHSIIPQGLCQCGCGQITKLAQKTNRAWQLIKNQPLRFIHGHNSLRPYVDPVIRFWARVNKTADCWIWTGQRLPKGYGIFSIRHHSNRANRFSYELHYGPIPKGMNVCHHCDNPPCVRPEHLFLGTDKDNTQDMMRKGRHRIVPLLGEAHGCAKLTDELVRELRKEHSERGTPVIDIARRFNMSPTAICAMLKKKSWRHIS